MDMGLQGKVAVVTGGALTLGREIAMALSAEGAQIAIADLKEDEAKGVADQIIAGGGEALAVKTDVSRGAQVRSHGGAGNTDIRRDRRAGKQRWHPGAARPMGRAV